MNPPTIVLMAPRDISKIDHFVYHEDHKNLIECINIDARNCNNTSTHDALTAKLTCHSLYKLSDIVIAPKYQCKPRIKWQNVDTEKYQCI